MVLKKVMFAGAEARKKLLKGAVMAGEYVGKTLGPAGRNAILYSAYHAPKITNDGVSLLRTMVLDDETEDLGCQVIVEAAMKTNERAGDGTTTTGVIASRLVADCAEVISRDDGSGADNFGSGGADVVGMSRKILDARSAVIARLGEMAKPVKKGDIKKIVSTSLGKVYPEYVGMVTDIVDKTGVDGYVSVEENFGTKYGIDSEVHPGMRFMGSYATPAMTLEKVVGENLFFNKRKEAIMEDCPVLVTNHRIDSLAILKKLAEELRQAGKRRLLIVAAGYEQGFIMRAATLAVSALQGNSDSLRVLAIKAPSLTTDQMLDVAAYAGAVFVDKAMKSDISQVGITELGNVRKVVVDEDHASMDGGVGDVKSRVDFIKAEIEQEKDPSFKEQARRRLGALQSGFAIIRVGAATEPERQYIRLKIEDAVNAAKAAMEEGVIQGGGVPLAKIAAELGSDSIVYGALREPHERIKANAGGKLIVPADVLDPVKVTRLAVENAFSVAAALITCEVSVTQRRRTLLDELGDKLAPQDNEHFADEENTQVGYRT